MRRLLTKFVGGGCLGEVVEMWIYGRGAYLGSLLLERTKNVDLWSYRPAIGSLLQIN